MAVDDIKKTFWIFTNQSIYELVIKNEERDVWKLYLEKGQYDTALQYCKDPAQKDKVYTARARDYFDQRRYQMSAKYFAESTVPFEEVSLKFVEKDERDALRVYLISKLERFRKKVRRKSNHVEKRRLICPLGSNTKDDCCDVAHRIIFIQTERFGRYDIFRALRSRWHCPRFCYQRHSSSQSGCILWGIRKWNSGWIQDIPRYISQYSTQSDYI